MIISLKPTCTSQHPVPTHLFYVFKNSLVAELRSFPAVDVLSARAGGDLTQIHSRCVVFAADIDFALKGIFFHLQSERFLSTMSWFRLELQISSRVKPSDKIFPVVELEKRTPRFCSSARRLMILCLVLSDLPMEYNPSDHPRASTIFLSKSQTDGEPTAFLLCTQAAWFLGLMQDISDSLNDVQAYWSMLEVLLATTSHE